MSNVDEYITYVFTWRTSRDEQVCPICHPLDGQVIFFDLFAPVLVSDTHGAIWDLNGDFSLAHGVRRYNCRCTLDVDVEVDWDKIAEFNELKTNLELMGIRINLRKEVFKLSSTISVAREQMGGFLGDLGKVKTEIREVNQGFTTYLALADESGLPRSMIQGLRTFQQVRIAVEMLHRSFIMMQAATGPIGWLVGLGTFTVSTLMLVDQMEIRRPRY